MAQGKELLAVTNAGHAFDFEMSSVESAEGL